MSCHTKPELENMLEDVINELDLSEQMIQEHGQHGTAPAILVRMILDRKDLEIKMLKQGFKSI
jgi:hypothetical protein